jgi:hypothetical protein
MNTLSRRGLRAVSAAAITAAQMPRLALGQTPDPIRLAATTRTLDIDGRAVTAFGLAGPRGPGLILDPGQRFRVDLTNDLEIGTIIHWHGQVPPNEQDGVPGMPMQLLAPGERRSYDYPARPGTHWMHSHVPVQEMQLLAAPLIVRSQEDLAADRQEVVLFLHDFSFKPPEEVLAEITGAAARTGHGAHDGHGGVQPMLGMHAMTGNHRTAEAVASRLGIDKVPAGVLPEDRQKLVEELRANGKSVAMAGDGVDDAPALAAAVPGVETADAFIAALWVQITHGPHDAHYRIDLDHIFMPPSDAFDDTVAFYGTLIHEAAHATGAKHRLDRDFGGRFHSGARAIEEITAELTVGFVLADLGLAHRPRPDHAAYVASWLKDLKHRRSRIAVASTSSPASSSVQSRIDLFVVMIMAPRP